MLSVALSYLFILIVDGIIFYRISRQTSQERRYILSSFKLKSSECIGPTPSFCNHMSILADLCLNPRIFGWIDLEISFHYLYPRISFRVQEQQFQLWNYQ